MVNFCILFIATLASFTAAEVLAIEKRQSPTDHVIPTNPAYYLQTKVINGDPSKNGLYVSAYHYGAGINAATLVSDRSVAAKGFYNDTEPSSPYQEFDLGNAFPWGLTLVGYAGYDNWWPVQINAGFGDPGFVINGSSLVKPDGGWMGWLACDWTLLVPQLFWALWRDDFDIPCSCAWVELCATEI